MSESRTDRAAFESAVQALEADAAAAAVLATYDAEVRAQYQSRITQFVDELRARARTGRVSWADAAAEARSMRNTTMEALRIRSTPVGRAIAEALKAEGATLNELIARYAVRLFGPDVDFNRLTAAQKNRVYAEIVEAAARSNPRVNQWMRTASRAGRGLIVLSLGLSVYAIATSDNPAETAKREVAVTGAGILGAAATGALAGLACGPGAPVCVTVAAFAGGAAAAFGVDFFWSD